MFNRIQLTQDNRRSDITSSAGSASTRRCGANRAAKISLLLILKKLMTGDLLPLRLMGGEAGGRPPPYEPRERTDVRGQCRQP